jgi:hypothetical protein
MFGKRHLWDTLIGRTVGGVSMPNTVKDAGRKLGDLAECIDKQVELANKMVPLVG